MNDRRNLALDLLKLLLAFMVVGIHTQLLKDYSQLVSHLLVNGVFNIAVPIFFLINGYYFYYVETNGKTYAWFKRILTLYLTWLFFYSYIWLTWVTPDLKGILKVIYISLFGYHHLWYLTATIGAGLVHILLRGASVSQKSCVAIILFITGFLVEMYGNYYVKSDSSMSLLFHNLNFFRNFLFFGFPFFTIGYLINEKNINIKNQILVLLLLVGLIALMIESYTNFYLLSGAGRFDILLSLFIVCPVVFLLVLKSNIASDSKQLAVLSVAIYLIHPYAMNITVHILDAKEMIYFFSVVALSMLLAIPLIFLNKKIKFIL